MELNREQVVKALECCTSEQGCGGCPYYPTLIGCSRQAMSGALALIRELTEENERLRAEAENQSVLWKQHFESIYETAKGTVKADTVRKMQERLKKAFNFGHTIFEKSICDIIDQVAKELLEEVSDG